nr:DsbA family protein [Endobacter medicaginis]
MASVNACVRPDEADIAAPVPPIGSACRPDASVAGPDRVLHLSVLHDLICPWSRLAICRLLRVLSRRGRPWSIVWEPFLLHAEMPRLGMAYVEYARQKYGTAERARRMERTVSALGRGEGVGFRFDRIQRVPSTIAAHRLIEWASSCRTTPDHLAGLVLSLSTAHFERGLDLSLPSVLAEIAAMHGLDPNAARAVLLRGREAADHVQMRAQANAALGINGIPCLVTEDGLAIAGAQDEPAIERLLDVAELGSPAPDQARPADAISAGRAA